MVVDQPWRAQALAEMIDEAGLVAEITHTDENTPLVRTAVDARLRPIAGEWTRGAVKTVPAAVAARAAGAAGLDTGGRHPGSRPLSAGTGSARAGHPFAAGVGADAGRDRADPDRHPRGPAGAADQRPAQAIAAGRERWGTARRRRGVALLAARLAAINDAGFTGGRFASAHPGCHIVRCLRRAERAPQNDAGWSRTFSCRTARGKKWEWK